MTYNVFSGTLNPTHSLPPYAADVAFRVELRQSARGGRREKSPVVVVDESLICAACKICLKG